MTIIRPVTETIPATRDMIEESPIPLGFAITPYASRPDLFTFSTHETIYPSSNKQDSHINFALPIQASLVARCTHCGAPLNPSSLLISLETALCALCGQTFLITYESQTEARNRAESLLLGRKKKYTHKDEEKQYKQRWTGQRVLEECNHAAIEYSLPLIHIRDNEATETYTPIYSLPVTACPPLIALLIDGTSTDALYYNTLSSTLTQWLLLNHSEKKGTRMGMFILTRYGGLSVFDLSSTMAHLKHIYVPPPPSLFLNLDSKTCNSNLSIHNVLDFHEIFVPLDVNHSLARIETALRALADYTTVIQDTCTRRPTFDTTPGGVYLGSTIQALLQFLDHVGAHHPGKEEEAKYINLEEEEDRILYTGGKIYCFLSGPPFEIGMTTSRETTTPLRDSKMEHHFSGTIGRGGFGGACAPIGKRFDLQSLNSQRAEEDRVLYALDDVEADSRRRDLVDPNLDRPIPVSSHPFNAGNYFQSLGIDCAQAALGVEIITLVSLYDEEDRLDNYIGIPVLRLLSQYSGGNGPILIPIRRGPENDLEILSNELLARSPWYRPHAYGATLKIRLSRSLTISTHSLKPSYKTPKSILKRPDFKWSYSVGNSIHGSVSPSDRDASLLMMGTCDDFSTISFMIDISPKTGSVINRAEIDDRTIDLPPCIQSSFVYTALIKAGSHYIAVRRLRVFTMSLAVATDPEQFFKSLDAEVLGVILFHRLCDISFNQGLREAQVFGRQWLLSALVILYQSANLNRESLVDLTNHEERERLLGNQSLPLLVFCLMQCDALRLSDAHYHPSLDSRASASSNMFNMPPSVLARCIAPRLELWYLGFQSKEFAVESIDMCLSSLVTSTGELVRGQGLGTPIVFLDSPNQIYLNTCSVQSKKSLKPIPEFQQKRIYEAINEAVNSYRVPPPVDISFDIADAWLSSPHIVDSLIEDSHNTLFRLNFKDWCSDIAEIVNGKSF